MAHTDDIAEKVAGLLLDQTARAANFTYDAGAALAKNVGVLTKNGFKQLLSEQKAAEELRKIDNLTGEISYLQMNEFTQRLGMRSSATRVAMADAKEYEELLQRNNVLYAKADVKDDNCKVFFFLTRDQQKVNNINESLDAKRGLLTEVAPDLYFRDVAPKDVRIVQGVDPVEMELFRHYARAEGFLFTAIKKQDKYTVAFGAEDERKARKAMLHVGWDLTGQGGARCREQVEYRLKGRSALQISAMEAQRELYVVSQRNPDKHICISSEDCAMYKKGKRVDSVARSSPDFYTKCLQMVDSLDGAVLVAPGMFHPDMTREELAEYHPLDLHPADYDTLVEMDRQNNLINLVAMKSGMDNEHNASWGLWDPSVSYGEFSGYEYIMDTEEREAREREFEHFKEAAYYSINHHDVQDIALDERSVDFAIAKAEEKRAGYTQGEPQRSHAPHQSQHEQDDDKSL